MGIHMCQSLSTCDSLGLGSIALDLRVVKRPLVREYSSATLCIEEPTYTLPVAHHSLRVLPAML